MGGTNVGWGGVVVGGWEDLGCGEKVLDVVVGDLIASERAI